MGITQEELAIALGVTRPMISQIERGTRPPSAVILMDIATFFNVSMEYIVKG